MGILDTITEKLHGKVKEANFEGANIVLYTDNENFFREGEGQIKKIVDEIKKRIELRADQKILPSKEATEKKIRQIIPEEAEITEILFDAPRSIVVIEAKKPGLVIGKGGSILEEIRKETLWVPQVQRSPAIKSKITENIREVLYDNNNYRRKFLNEIGEKIYKGWNPDKIEEWVRLGFLGSGRQVGRSCLLLQTPNSNILLDCGIDVASSGNDKFPYFNIPEFDISQLDAIILSHAHLDHCLPPSSLVLTEKGYKEIKDLEVGENVISLDWKTGKYVKSKCTEKTNTTGHKEIFTIKTPYSKIESSPNHKFFIFEDLKLKEVRADELKEGMLLPSNLLNKPPIPEKEIHLDINVRYDIRRKDDVVLPSLLNSQLAEFIGYFAGDGHKSSDFSLRTTDSSLQILNYHKEIIKKLFNYEGIIRHHSDKTKNAFVLEINNVKIIRFLEKNFPEIFLKTKEVGVPEKIINSSLNIQSAFIRGVADADGTVTNIVKICSFSERMLGDLQYLFSNLEIPSNIKNDHTICLNTNFSISQFHKKIGFSIDCKQNKLAHLLKQSNFKKQDLIPITPRDLRRILKEIGMLGRIHDSPKISELLPMCLLDLFRRERGYATRETVIKLVNLLNQRLVILNENKLNTNLYALRQLLSITRNEVSMNTGLKVHQVQQIEENRLLSVEYVNLLSSYMKEKISSIICQIEQNINVLGHLLSLNVIWEPIKKLNVRENNYPYLVDIETEHKNFIAGNVIVHNSGLLPYLYKMGYRGPVYMTAPTRDISALLALDFIGVAYKQAATPLFSSADIKEMVKHSICLNYNEVTDVTPDIRITFYNAGHVLGSSQVHINIGNGLHNFVYTGDMKYGKTRLLDPAVNRYTRVESIQVESTYGSKDDILPPRKDTEKKFIDMIRETVEKGGKVLLPELGLGHAQETLLRVEEAIRTGELPKIPMYIDGMIWDINAIHTAYPDFLSANIRSLIFQDKNPFVSDIFVRVASPQERKQVIEGGPCIVIATSGMLVGGASVEYFRYFADNPNNLVILSSYQGPGSLGRKLQDGEKVVQVEAERGMQEIKVNMRVELLSGLTPHSGRNELMSFFNNIYPKPKRILINHGEVSKSLDLASSLYKVHRVETTVPRNLEIVRLR